VRARRGDPAKQVAMVRMFDKGAGNRRLRSVVMENQPTLAYVCQKQTRAGPKMGMDPGLACTRAQDCTRKGPGVKHRPKVTERWTATLRVAPERGSLSRALSDNAGEGDQAGCRDGVGCRVSFAHAEAKAWGNAQDALTWGG
jgi:hypothetical protein